MIKILLFYWILFVFYVLSAPLWLIVLVLWPFAPDTDRDAVRRSHNLLKEVIWESLS